MKSIKEKNAGSIISTTSPNTETEIALSQKLQREEVLSLSFQFRHSHYFLYFIRPY